MMYALIILIILVLIYPKTRFLSIIKKHIKTLYNAKVYDITNSEKKIYWLDILFFYFLPIFVASYVIFFQDAQFLSSDQINVFYLIFLPILFGSLAVINSSISNSKNEKYNIYAKEVFYNIAYGCILSLLGILVNLIASISNSKVIYFAMLYIFISFVLLLVLAIKRMVVLLDPDTAGKGK